MDALEQLLRPVAGILNRKIQETTPARELCEKLDGTVAAVRVRDTALAMYISIDAQAVALSATADKEPDVAITGSLLTLARLVGGADENALRYGSLDLAGDAARAQAFQRLLRYAKPDLEEGLSAIVGDPLAHGIGEFARGVRDWAQDARNIMGDNIREYLQEEGRDAPSRYEVERFSGQVSALRDDVDRLAARIDRLKDTA